MLTNPSTLGLFDENIEEIRDIFHGVGALMYYDGANLNAVCGISRPGDMGFDVVHINLHKTFSQPHGGGGPGGGPIAVRASLEPFLPVPVVVKDDNGFRLDYDRPKSIGKVRAFTGPFGVFVRSYAFMRAYGPGLREMSEVAVLNANYMLARLKEAYELPFDRLCMHEFVLSARTLKREHGITALDVAKRLMDYGFHPPTVYFPLVVAEALMIEPTESEAKETLGRVLRRDAGDRPRGGRRAGDRRARRPTTGRFGGSTRSGPRSSRSSSTPSTRCPGADSQARNELTSKRSIQATTNKGDRLPNKVVKTEAEWRAELSPEQYRVLREKGTEAPWTGEYDAVFEPGTLPLCGLRRRALRVRCEVQLRLRLAGVLRPGR